MQCCRTGLPARDPPAHAAHLWQRKILVAELSTRVPQRLRMIPAMSVFGIESRAREHVGELLSYLGARIRGTEPKTAPRVPNGRAGQPSLAVLTSTVFFSRGDGLWGGDGI